MRNFAVAVCLLALFALAVPGSAQDVTAGVVRFQPAAVDGGVLTTIDFGHPINIDGAVNNATVMLVSAVCPFKIRIFRRASVGGDTFTVVGEAGPFNLPAAGRTKLQTVTFGSIPVKQGDYLAVVQLAGCSSGGVIHTSSPNIGEFIYQIPADYNGGALPGGKTLFGRQISAIVSSATSRLLGVVPVVGTAQGLALFRSSIQLTNPSFTDAIDGRLVYHAAGALGGPGDPSIDYHLDPLASLTINDIGAAFGRTGVASLDVYSSGVTPEATVRVFNDNGAAGTFGFSQDLVPVDAMANGRARFVRVPISPDLTNFRVNIGLRTLSASTFLVDVIDAAGNVVVGNIPKSYNGNTLEQVGLAQFIGVAPPAGGHLIISLVTGGPAVYYTSTIDNRTNDSSFKLLIPK